MDPPIGTVRRRRRALQAEPLRELRDEGSGGLRAKVLMGRTGDDEIEVGASAASHRRREDPAVERHGQPISARRTGRAGCQDRTTNELCDPASADILIEPGRVCRDAIVNGGLRRRRPCDRDAQHNW